MTQQNRRPIRSYVRRGRLTRGQKQALDRHWNEYGVPFTPEPLDLDCLFGRPSPKVLDIGCGMGESTVALARLHPENDYLAVEVHQPGVGSLVRHAALHGVTNLRIICRDVMEVLRCQLRAASLDEVYLFFPDPWHKKRHRKRRLVNARFLELLVPRMKSHARLFLATDSPELAQHMLAVCDAYPGLINLAGHGNFAPRPAWRPRTKFELRGVRGDRRAWDLCFARDRHGNA